MKKAELLEHLQKTRKDLVDRKTELVDPLKHYSWLIKELENLDCQEIDLPTISLRLEDVLHKLLRGGWNHELATPEEQAVMVLETLNTILTIITDNMKK